MEGCDQRGKERKRKKKMEESKPGAREVGRIGAGAERKSKLILFQQSYILQRVERESQKINKVEERGAKQTKYTPPLLFFCA